MLKNSSVTIRTVTAPCDTLRITTLQKQDPTCFTLLSWITSSDFPPWIEVKGLSLKLRLLWHHRNNLSVDDNGVIWWKRSSQSCYNCWFLSRLANNCSCHIMHLCLAAIWAEIGHWPRWHITFIGLACRMISKNGLDNVLFVSKERKSLAGRHHPLGNIPTGHRWDRIDMDILDVCDPTPDGYRCILVIADYFSKWTEAFPIKNKCADTVADMLVEKIILRFGMPLVMHSDQGRECAIMES